MEFISDSFTCSFEQYYIENMISCFVIVVPRPQLSAQVIIPQNGRSEV